MSGKRIPGEKGTAGPLDHILTSRATPAVLFVLYMVLSILLASGIDSFIAFRVLYPLWFLVFLKLLYTTWRSGLIDRLDSLDPWKAALMVLGVALLVQIPFLLADPSLSQDVHRMVIRGDYLLDGRMPYRDFTVNKPPLYIWMVGLISYLFGASQTAFRVFFSLVLALVPATMVFLRGPKGAPRKHRGLPGLGWTGGALGIALCPVPVLETALAGHFDPLVVLLVLLSFLLLKKDRPLLSSILLGAGAALKIWPLLVLPIFLLALPSMKKRAIYAAGFIWAPLLSAVPVLLVDPSLMWTYLFEQTGGWGSSMSISYGIDTIFSAIGIPDIATFLFMTCLLIATVLSIYYLGWAGRSTLYPLLTGLLMLSLLSLGLIGYSTLILLSVKTSIMERAFASLGIALSLAMMVWSVHHTLAGSPFERPPGEKSKFDINSTVEMKDVPLMVTGVLLILLATSSQFHPWYLIWVLPFAVTVQPRLSWSVLALAGALQVGVYPPWEL